MDEFLRQYLQPRDEGKSELTPSDKRPLVTFLSMIVDKGYTGPIPKWLQTDFSDPEENNSTAQLLSFLVSVKNADTPNENLDYKTLYERTNSDKEHLLSVKDSLLEELHATRQQVALLTSRIEALNQKHRNEKSLLQREIDALNKQILAYKQREDQFQHEIRKYSRDIDELRDKLRAMIVSKDRLAKNAMAVHKAPIDDHNDTRNQVDQLKLLVENYENKVQELTRQNDQLKLMLDAMTKQFVQRFGVKPADLELSTEARPNGPDSLVITHPTNTEQLWKNLKQTVDQLITILEKYPQTGANAELQAKLVEYQKLIAEQDKLLAFAVRSNIGATSTEQRHSSETKASEN